MDTVSNSIQCECHLFACRVCRTKAGFPNQTWCSAGTVNETCEGCNYWDKGKKRCIHPRNRKGGDVAEKREGQGGG